MRELMREVALSHLSNVEQVFLIKHQNKERKKKRNTRRLCLRHARFYFTTGEKSENDARDANERRRSCAFLLVARSQQQRLFDFVRVIISLLLLLLFHLRFL
jgi:DNA-binding LacI/PurR family transcriptional regulator